MKLKKLLLMSLLSTGLVGTSYANYQDVLDKYIKGQYEMTINEFKIFAKQDKGIQTNLDLKHENGTGELNDYKQVAKWFNEAADQGDAQTKFDLALVYEGVLMDDKEAIKWYQVAANQGNSSAQLNLGRIYINNKGALMDLSKAKHWIKKAYENKNASAGTVRLAKSNWNKLELWKY